MEQDDDVVLGPLLASAAASPTPVQTEATRAQIVAQLVSLDRSLLRAQLAVQRGAVGSAAFERDVQVLLAAYQRASGYLSFTVAGRLGVSGTADLNQLFLERTFSVRSVRDQQGQLPTDVLVPDEDELELRRVIANGLGLPGCSVLRRSAATYC